MFLWLLFILLVTNLSLVVGVKRKSLWLWGCDASSRLCVTLEQCTPWPNWHYVVTVQRSQVNVISLLGLCLWVGNVSQAKLSWPFSHLIILHKKTWKAYSGKLSLLCFLVAVVGERAWESFNLLTWRLISFMELGYMSVMDKWFKVRNVT